MARYVRKKSEMKNVALLGLASLLLVSAGAQAVSLSGQIGKDYTNFGLWFWY